MSPTTLISYADLGCKLRTSVRSSFDLARLSLPLAALLTTSAHTCSDQVVQTSHGSKDVHLVQARQYL